MANEEARAAAPSDAWFVDQYWRTTGGDWAIPDHVMVAFGRKMYAEGIRQAREAVAGEERRLVDLWLGAEAEGAELSLRAIDALGEER